MQKYQDVVLNQNGNPVSGVQVTVTDLAGSPVAVYSSNAIGLNVNPLTSDNNGRFSFYAPDGRYSLTFTFGGNVVASISDILLEDPMGGSDAVFNDVTMLGSLSDASKITSAAVGGISATNVQDALSELDSDKASNADLSLKVNSADLAAPGGAALVGFQQSGTGAAERDSESKLRERVSVPDFGSNFDSAFPLAISEMRLGRGELFATPSAYAPASTPEIVGEFANGLVVHGDRAVITSGSTIQDGILIGNKVGSVASSYFNKLKLTDLVLVGAGKTGTAAGVHQQAAADIQVQNFRIRNFNVGVFLDGGLTSDYSGLNVRDNGVGIKADFFDDGAGGLNSFAPNANTFYGARVFYNDVAVKYLYNPSGCANWIGSNFEANNGSGNATDGVKVIELENAGHHNFIGTHHESNLGQYGIWFNGFDNTKNLLMLGCDVIDATGTNLHMERGRLTSVGSRITNTSSTHDIYLNTGARATLIDTEGAISGDLSAVAAIRDGRIGFGVQPTVGAPVIDMRSEVIAASSNVAASFRNDTVQVRFMNTAGTRVAYLQTTAAGDHLLNNDNAAGGWSIRANNTARLYVGRSGGDSIEPGAATTNCGTATLPWNGVFAKTVRTMGTTVAALPTAASAGAGARAFVTDANARTFDTVAAGGGSNAVPVWSDGTNWRIG